jgi:glycine betaine/proline transport system substrate-binding protein
MICTTQRLIRMGVAFCGVALLALLTACSGGGSSFSSGGSSGGGSGGATGGDDKNLTIALSPGFDEDIAVTYLWKELLEKRGYTIQIQELEVGQAYVGTAQGQADLYLDAWLPTAHETYWERFGPQLETLSGWYSPATLNLAVPEYMTDVNSIQDLAGKEAEFGSRIVGIEAGTGLMRLSKDAVIPDYQLSGYQLLESSTPAMLSSLDQAIATQKPIVVTLWTPHWAFTKFPIKALEDPKGAFGAPDTATAVATKGFSEAQPDVAKWLRTFKLTDQQLGSLELLLQEKGDGKQQEAAVEWIAANQQVVDSWFK